MVQVRKKPQVTVATKDGECDIHISVDVNVNLNSEGLVVKVAAATAEEGTQPEESRYVVPEFKTERIKFGQKV